MNLSFHVMQREIGDGFMATVLRDGKIWGERGPYGTRDEANRAVDLMAGDVGARVGDNGDGAKTLTTAAR